MILPESCLPSPAPSLTTMAGRTQRDQYYRLAKQEGYRARSAFKLLEIDAVYGFLTNISRAVDLCAAPGSWSQVLSRRVRETNPNGRVVSVDLNQIAPIDGVTAITGDITTPATAAAVVDALDGLADVVTCDGAPDITGLHAVDEDLQNDLINAALIITRRVLREGGTFVCKIFRARDVDLLISRLTVIFEEVTVVKPPSSRAASAEAFIVGRKFKDCDEKMEKYLYYGDLSCFE